MMNPAPEHWWFVLTGVFFGLFILLLIILIVVALQLVATIKQVGTQLNHLGDRVDKISTRVEELLVNVKSTTHALGTRADNIGQSFEIVSSAFANRAQTLASVLTGIMLIKNFLGNRRNRR